MAMVWLNGQYVDEDSAAVSIRDAGLLHGAGVFTTMRAYGGRVFRLDAHLTRLRESCDALSLPLPYKNAQLTAAVGELLQRNSLADARLRLTVTRGVSHVDPLHGMYFAPTVFLTATQLEPYPAEYYQRGMTAILLDDQKLNPYDPSAGHKTLSYFSRLAALREAGRRGAGEALWFNVHNYLQSGSISNVFVVKDGALFTPPTPAEMRDPAVAASCPYPRSAVLPGITRQTVIDLARREHIEVRLAAINVSQLVDCHEVFVTNSIMQVMPVCRLERKAVGDDKPGPITRRLAELYNEELKRCS